MPFVIAAIIALAGTWMVWSLGRWKLEAERVSDYSHIRVRRKGDIRDLRFVRDSGREVVETRVDLTAPHELQLPYTRMMFMSYVVVPAPRRVLIIGLGGGAMVHFLRRHDPDVRIDVVEIDPVVVDVADRYFDMRSGDGVRIVTEDAFSYFARNETRYDVIYMDAFLKPSGQTDAAGVPQRLRTVAFHDSLRDHLTAGGAVAFNLTPHAGTRRDIATIRESFADALVFRCPPATNLVVIAPSAAGPVEEARLSEAAGAADVRLAAGFSLRDAMRHLERPIAGR